MTLVGEGAGNSPLSPPYRLDIALYDKERIDELQR